jgi:hypothetical protein
MIPSNIELLYAFPEYKPLDLYEFVLLAIELMDQYESEAMVIVAGFNRKVDIFEITPYLTQWKRELNIPELNRDDSLFMYAFPIVRRVATEESIREYLTRLEELCIESDYSKDLYDFYLLSCALQDFDYSDNQWYFENLTKENSKEKIRGIATIWLEKHQERHDRLLSH